MKTTIDRLSPHQNGKVFAVLMAVSSLLFVVPFMLITIVSAPAGQSFPIFMVVAFPVMYLVFSYIFVVAGCWIYNRMVKYTGGIEFEASSE